MAAVPLDLGEAVRWLTRTDEAYDLLWLWTGPEDASYMEAQDQLEAA